MGTQYTFLYPKLFTAPSRVESPPSLQSPRSADAPSFLPFLPAIGTQAATAAFRIELCDCVSGFPSGLRPPASHRAPSPPVLCTPAGDRACLPFSLLPPLKRNTEGGKQNASLNKAKKDKLVGATGKNVRTETSMVSVTLRVKPELTLPATCEGALLESGSADCTVKLWDVAFSTKALRTEDTKGSSSANRLRLLKSLPTKSAPVYSLRSSRKCLSG
uniref:Uncharacterized protein n=1 Tax=Zea mays TaxID=4577 RepID=A0A804PHR7_MAIZE